MSHFTVLVIGNDPEIQLAPYSENIEMPEYHKEQVSAEDQQRMIDYYVEKSGFVYNDNFDDLYAKHGKEWNSMGWRRHTDGTYHEYSTYNPQSKWDWYELGGRWTGFFKLIAGEKGKVGRPGIMTSPANEGMADAALKKYIDFEGMQNEAGDIAAERYDKVMAVLGEFEANRPWKEIGEQFKYTDEARSIYADQPRVKAWNENNLSTGFYSTCDDFLVSKEVYVSNARNSAISTFAVVKDGVWYEKGEMGWFACVSNDKGQEAWNTEFSELINSIPDDTLLSLYDCHI